MNPPDYQQHFFQQLARHFPNRTAMARAVGEELGLGAGTVNRRIAGSTQLRIDELLQLAQRFGIALPDGRTQGIPFQFNNVKRKVNSPADYVEQLSERLQQVDEWPDKELCYASNDLPIFYEL
ncbi:MAG: hypothetical protein AAFN92_02190, partial [Bacteroidota bacterium]